MALGVPRETVLRDYLLTNRYLERRPDFLHALKGIPGFDPDSFDASAIEVMSEAREEYLGAALSEIDEGPGGIDAYLRGPIGLTDASIAELRARYLD
jgi:protein-tyrosine phosphatase